jgi:large subunit ribosomal protein L21
MDVYAVVETGGKQYRVEPNRVLDVELLDAEVGKKVKLDRVLALGDGKALSVGTPTLPGLAVTAEILKHFRGDKLVAFKKKRRKGYKRKVGHRQELTRIKILDIGGAGKGRSKAATEAPATPADSTPTAKGARHGA